MSSDVLIILLSSGIGATVAAGILSAIAYLVTHRDTSNRGPKSVGQWNCATCNDRLRSIDGILDPQNVIACIKCSKRVCKSCAHLNTQLPTKWMCHDCHQDAPQWLHTLFDIIPSDYCKRLLTRGGGSTFTTMDTDPITDAKLNDDIEAIRRQERIQIRDFIERLVNALVGENVDDASVTRIYNDRPYNALLERYHQDLTNTLIDLGSALHISIANLPVSGQSPSTAHAALKQLIERLLRDATELPTLNSRVEQHPATPSEEENRTYEDLLATAIVNKVVNKVQNHLPSSSAASVCSRASTVSRPRDEKEYFFGEETLETKWKSGDLETTSVSSLEEWLQSDSSLGSTKYVDKVSFTIQQRIEEGTGSDSDPENEPDDATYFRSDSSLFLESPNWYLQKRKFNGTNSPVPVPMLVPNPTTEAKVLIGDRELDDTSDLSDAVDDYGDTESVPGIKSLLVESKMVIGGKNMLNSLQGSDAESSADSGVREDRGDLDLEEDKFYEEKPKADITVDDENVEDASLLSVYSNTEKDTEYTERYASLPRTVEKSRMKNTSTLPSKHSESSDEENDRDEAESEFSGQYSKREKEKWKNPVEMSNNPYTKENIEKRIRGSQIFGRDYYTRQASLPSGTRKLDETMRQFAFGEDQEDTYRATPTFVEDDEVEIEPKIIATSTSNREIPENDYRSLSEITSDSDLSLVNCYDVEHSKVYRRTSDGGEEEITVTTHTEGLLYISRDPDEVPVIENGKKSPEVSEESSDEADNYDIKIMVNSEGLLHEPEEFDAVEAPKSPLIDENHNVTPVVAEPVLKPQIQENVPQIKPRQSLQPKVQLPIAPRRNLLIKDEPKKTEPDDFNAPPTILHQKSDNTWLKRIYSNPVVRSFALTNREQIPVNCDSGTVTPSITSPTDPWIPVIKPEKSVPIAKSPVEVEKPVVVPVNHHNNNDNGDKTDSSDNFSLEFSDHEPLQRQCSAYRDPEITELKGKRLVASRLGQFSKSFPNLSMINNTNRYNRDRSKDSSLADLLEGEYTTFTSVKDLKKKFESNNALSTINNNKPVHSLTARSISKPIREQLKSEESIESIEDAEPQFQEVVVEDVVLNSQHTIKFYESLKE